MYTTRLRDEMILINFIVRMLSIEPFFPERFSFDLVTQMLHTKMRREVLCVNRAKTVYRVFRRSL